MFFIGIIMKNLSKADFNSLEEYENWHKVLDGYVSYGYAYTSNGARVTFRTDQNKKYGRYNVNCIVANHKGEWLDTFVLAYTGYDCSYPSICEPISQQ